MSNENLSQEDKEFLIKELKQERFFGEEITNYLEENNIISQEVFDSLSHELRTPIVAIKAYVDMLLKGYFSELRPEQKEKIEIIKENTDILIKVISEILEKSKKLK